MYPQVFVDYSDHRRKFGKVSHLPTPVFFYGMETGDEIAVEIEKGKTLIIRFLALGEVDDNNMRTVFFELNGQPRSIRIKDNSIEKQSPEKRFANHEDPNQIAAPMPGVISSVVVEVGQKVKRGDTLLSIEAMKMETAVISNKDGIIDEIVASVGVPVDAKDLLVVLKG